MKAEKFQANTAKPLDKISDVVLAMQCSKDPRMRQRGIFLAKQMHELKNNLQFAANQMWAYELRESA